MNEQTIKNAVESILFIAGDAVEVSEAAASLEVEQQELECIVDELIQQKQVSGAGVLIKRVGTKIQMCSNPEYMDYIDKTLQPVKKTSLSQSLLETLAIIAYNQPVTRFDIEQIRGVRCNYSIALLVERGLIDRVGRKKTLGNPMLYATTEEFLRHFDISSLDELPELSQG